MAVQGPFKVACGDVFPHGVGIVGAVTPLADFDASTRESRVQARDKDTGLPLWVVDVVDFDPEARERTLKVKIAAAVQPVPPEAVAGAPVRPVLLEGLTVTPYVKETPPPPAGKSGSKNGGEEKGPRAKVAYSLKATGFSSPRRSGGDTNRGA
jgi:hypothetical protein